MSSAAAGTAWPADRMPAGAPQTAAASNPEPITLSGAPSKQVEGGAEKLQSNAINRGSTLPVHQTWGAGHLDSPYWEALAGMLSPLARFWGGLDPRGAADQPRFPRDARPARRLRGAGADSRGAAEGVAIPDRPRVQGRGSQDVLCSSALAAFLLTATRSSDRARAAATQKSTALRASPMPYLMILNNASSENCDILLRSVRSPGVISKDARRRTISLA